MEVTKDFQRFVNSIFDINYHEIYELYQAASGNEESVTLFRVEPANGSDDTLIIYEPANMALRLTPKAKNYFPEWIEANLMDGLDAEGFYGMKYAMERDAEREAKGLD
ncbi:hypothetical protein [Porphyromonas levii]|uniref:hypothetical protein n=1 Tax=Porphyromonas levii TaxID=28114 RepID=UPI001B8D6298|nr:hypothetical protein [Porphyromonas levii]MBR8713345.1 hypothetical protein [Porphyromonas levii]MBR8715350.1 hypothetical protein [Porphyromonas levii]MBR8727875.1 hypothetical protein [Porphyromonas levii]MBR8736197.1 hypothetical protein [Porphyromonas levii]MBR8774017.1 hypothetical protein [Porphyromonas levii]